MLGDLYEFFFCPQHGLLRVQNWPFLIPAATSGVGYVVHKLCHRFKRLK